MSGLVVASLRRYPVKSMGGEGLEAVAITSAGLDGDRRFAFVDAQGAWASGKNGTRWRRHDEVFDYRAVTTSEGVEVVGAAGRWRVDDPALARHLSDRMDADVSLLAADRAQTDSDNNAVSIIGTATLAWCSEHLGVDADPRRLRVNIVIETDEPFVEETWLGRDVRLGEAVVHVRKQIERCRMVDVAQDGAAADQRWLKPLMAARGGHAAMGAAIVTPGLVRVGDRVVPAG